MASPSLLSANREHSPSIPLPLSGVEFISILEGLETFSMYHPPEGPRGV